MELYLVEHFYSIQGEGKYVGVPSLFIRFGGCNMKCEGFACQETAQDGTKTVGCDTIYAVNKEHFSQNWKQIQTTQELLNIVDSYTFPHAVDIVLTGGEPLIYANEEIFVEFLNEIHARGHRICFETNGSLDVDFNKYPVYKECVYALSIKLSNSNEPLKKRINANVIKSLTMNSKEAFFKFSIGRKSINKELEEEMSNIIRYAPKTQVYCMPMGADKNEIEKNSKPLVEFCKAKGYNFSDRLHMRIWDKQRGV